MRLLQFIAVILTALVFAPTGAHLFELPNKIILPKEQYFIVQSVYRGWALFGSVIIGAIAADLVAALALWRRRRRFWPSFAAALILIGTLVVFFVWTQPANVATDFWSVAIPGWEKLRAQWEFSHAANAALSFIALCCAGLSAVLSQD